MKNITKKICNLLDNLLRIIIIILIILKVVNSEFSDIGMLILTFVLSFYNVFLKKIFKINLNSYSRILLTLLIFLAQCLGTSLDFYDLFNSWDLIVHFISGIVMFFVGYDVISNLDKNHKEIKLNNKIIIIFSIFFALSVGSIWEMYEYSVDGILNLDTQRTGDLVGRMAIEDTMTDILSSTLGTLLTVITFIIIKRREKIRNLK
jgi:uncharacterized membrane protein YjdF